MGTANKSKSTVTIRSSAALPAAGAYDSVSAATELNVKQCTFIGLLLSYTRGAAGGACAIRVYDSVDGVNWYLRCVLDASSYASGAVDADPLTVKMPVSSGAAAELYALNLDVELATKIKIIAAEYGVTGTPGTLAIEALTGAGS